MTKINILTNIKLIIITAILLDSISEYSSRLKQILIIITAIILDSIS